MARPALVVRLLLPLGCTNTGYFRIEERFPLASNAWKRSLGIVVLASLFFSYAALLMGTLLNFGVNYLFGQPASLSGFFLQFPMGRVLL